MNKYKVDKMSNGLPLITIPIKGAPTVTALFVVKTGSKYETKSNNGLSHFLEHMFFKGTSHRPNTLSISSELDSLGGEYNAFTSKELTGYWIKVAANKLKPALNILSDMLLNSLFDAQEIEREKGVIIEELNMYKDNPLMHIEDVLEACLYGDTSAGWDTIGTKKNIQNFKRQDFIDYFNTQYGAQSIYLILAGGIKESDKKFITKILNKFPRNDWKNKSKVKEKQIKAQINTAFKKTDQVNLSLGVRTYPINHKEEFNLRLLAVILGGSMSSRLFINLRERNGLAYYVRTSTEFYSDSGYLTTQAGVTKDKAEKAIQIILNEYKKLRTELVKESELKRAKDLLQGKSLIQLEASDNLANWYAQQIITRNEVWNPKKFLDQIKKVTALDLRRTAKKIFVEERLNLALIGPVKDNDFKKILKF